MSALTVCRLFTGVLLLCVSAASSAVFLTSSGGTKSTFKGIATGTDLVCDLTGVPIDASSSPALFVLGGAAGTKVKCSEVLTGTSTVTKQGLFTLKQTALQNCLSVSGAVGDRVWKCVVGRDTLARWTITPDDTGLFCGIPNSSGFYSPCYAEHGTPVRPKSFDFPDRDVTSDGNLDFGADGVVFTFTERGGKLLFGPCHSGTFEGGAPVLCEQKVQGTVYKTRAAGSVLADSPVVTTDILPESLNLNNDSLTSTLPVVFFGATDADVSKIAPNNITVLGTTNPAPLAINSFSYGDFGPNGVPDGIQDLRIDFQRTSVIQRIITPAPTGLGVCPIVQTPLTLRFRGPYTGSGNNWTGLASVDVFNCPTVP